MRGKKDDKRVLRVGNGRQQSSKRKIRRNKPSMGNRRFSSNNQPVNRRRNRQKKKTNKSLVLIMIIALIAFVIGAGIGVSLSLDDGEQDEGPQFENVTKEMTSNLNDTEQVYFDKDVDGVDFNENETSQLDIQYKYSEN